MGISESKDTDSSESSTMEFDSFDESLSDDENLSDDESLSEPEEPHFAKIIDGEIIDPGDDRIDAAINALDLVTDKQFTLTDLAQIERNLDLYEKISLVFLLENDTPTALQICLSLLQGQSKEFLYSWAIRQHDQWQSKLLESLTIIQNYQILKSFGYEKSELIQRFLPKYSFSCIFINSIRKMLFYICENLNEMKTQQLVTLVRNDFLKRELEFKDIPIGYLEVYLLHWDTVGYIQSNNMTNIYKIFKEMGEDDIYEKLRPFVPNNQVNNNIGNAPRTRKLSNNKTGDFIISEHNANFSSSSSESRSRMFSIESNSPKSQALISCMNNYYEIDANNPGICLIINQEDFYREIEEQYIDLLPQTTMRLENRDGTQKDENELKSTFEQFGFTVLIRKNQTHIEMINSIRKVVENFGNESSLFVCILSHGDVGAVYGVNSCRVDVDKIQNILCSSKNLLGKPKVLILQSCQGNRLQKVIVEEDDLTTDGPSRSYTGPPTTDLFIFWATIPGYAAIRNKRTGSWFIQTLCNALRQFADKEHFEDICTFVVNDVTNRKWEIPSNNGTGGDGDKKIEYRTMVPLKNSTFTKRLRFPPIKPSS